MDQENWQYINAAASWFSALATFAAVLVSLYLARKNDRIALDLRAGIRKVVNRPGGRYVLLRLSVNIGDSYLPQEPSQIVWIGITNLGRRTVTITDVVLRPITWRKRGFPLIPAPSSHSFDLPTTLEDGKSATYGWLLSEFVAKEMTEKFRAEFKGFIGAIKLRWCGVCVGTSTGDMFR